MEVLTKIFPERPLPYQNRWPKVCDLGVLALGLISEYMGIDNNTVNQLVLHLKEHQQISKSASFKMHSGFY